jgi:hypothetical protein
MKSDAPTPDCVRVKRGKTGVCNICLAACDLKWDHVPPQGGVDVAPLDQYTILERLAGRGSNPNRVLTQNGVKYRTLCQNCNTKLLGGQYDRTLNDFALGIGRFLKTTLTLPTTTTFPTKPARLLRALFGHLLAAKAELEHTKPDEAMRQFVLSPAAALPPDLNVFYWIYPYPEVHVIRDVAMPSRYASLSKPGIFSMLKYFPVAYLVTNLREYEGLPSLSFYCPADIDAVVQLPLQLAGAKPPDWPEDGNNIIAGAGTSARSSVSAYPKGTNIRGPTRSS